ncbi:hypothetical protein BsWGS_06727 [Bradybaena similaris]
MEMNIRVLVMLTLVPGTLCQEIILDPPTLVTPCTSKARAAKDRFVFTGTFGKDVKQLMAQDWSKFLDIKAFHKKAVDYYLVCTMVLEDDVCESFNDKCSCVYQFKKVHFVVNYTLEAKYSRTPFGGYWAHNTKNIKVISNNLTLPEICDVNTARLTLTIAGVVGSLPKTKSCSFTLTFGTFNLMQLCCSDMALPCYTQISFRGIVVATNQSPCVAYAPTVDGVTGTLQLSYSVCTRTEYRQGNDCTIRAGVVTTRATAPPRGVVTPRATAPTTDVATTATDVATTATDYVGEVTSATDDGVYTPEFSGTTSDEYATGTTAPTTAAAQKPKRDNLPEAEEVEPPAEVEKSESIGSPSTVSEIESEV